jgi:hypothetical protein
MWKIILDQLLKYIETHPEVLQDLIGEGVKAGIAALKASNAKPNA